MKEDGQGRKQIKIQLAIQIEAKKKKNKFFFFSSLFFYCLQK